MVSSVFHQLHKQTINMRIFIVNGPNLNLLGEREPEVYGKDSLEDLNHWLAQQPEAQGCELEFFQSNHEGEIIDALQARRRSVDGFVINPGGLTHYSISLRDAVSACQVPTVEVHLSDIYAREPFRHVSMLKDVCLKQISGEGKQGYAMALSTLGATQSAAK